MKNKKVIDRVKSPAKKSGGLFRAVLFGVSVFIAFAMIYSIISRFASPDRYAAVGTIKQTDAYVESSGGAYLGELLGNVYSGNGTFQYLAGGTYTGAFDGSERSGEGSFTWDNGDSFIGTWEADAMKEGVYTFSDGKSFTGTFSEGKMENGTFTFGTEPLDIPDSDDDITKLVVTLADRTVSAIELETSTGYTYKGELSGSAEIKYPSGNTYSGRVSNCERDGQGTFTWWADNSVVARYEGTWSHGVMSGKGTYHYSSNNYPYLEGTFSEGKPIGTLVYYKTFGNTFDTTWENGKCTKVKET